MVEYTFRKPPSRERIEKILLSNDYEKSSSNEYRTGLPYSSISFNNVENENTVDSVELDVSNMTVCYNVDTDNSYNMFYVHIDYNKLKSMVIINY